MTKTERKQCQSKVRFMLMNCPILGLGQILKNPPTIQENQKMHVLYLAQENPLEEEMATHSSILVWRTPWADEPGGLQSVGS